MLPGKKKWYYTLRRLSVNTIVLIFSLFLNSSLALASPNLDIGTISYQLDYGESVYDVYYGSDEQDAYDGIQISVYLPEGAKLDFRLGTDSQGGCKVAASYGIDPDVDIDTISTSKSPNDWIGASVTAPDGYVWIWTWAEQCESWVEFPIEVYFDAEVSEDPYSDSSEDELEASYWTDDYFIYEGGCTNLNWEFSGPSIYEVILSGGAFSGEEVSPSGVETICPSQTTKYTFCVEYSSCSGSGCSSSSRVEECFSITLEVRESPEAEIDFWADDEFIQAGECTYLNWEFDDDYDAFLTGGEFDSEWFSGSSGRVKVCLTETTEYMLEVDAYDLEVRYVTIYVEPTPTPTDTPTPTKTPTKTPTPTKTIRPTVTPSRTPSPDSNPTSMPPYLILTHKGRLEDRLGRGSTWEDVEELIADRYGSDNYWVLDFEEELGDRDYRYEEAYQVLMREVNELGWPAYVIIIGGHEVVPFGVKANPATDFDAVVLSDDWYGNFVRDPMELPDVPVARVPDGNDGIDLIEAIFASNNERNAGQGAHPVYAQAQPHRPHATKMVAHILQPYGNHEDLNFYPIWSEPNLPGQGVFTNSIAAATYLDANYVYFILHGSFRDTSRWWGEGIQCLREEVNPSGDRKCVQYDIPEAFNVSMADSPGVVISGACYSAFIGGGTENSTHTPDNSIALRFLENGAPTFIGSTAITYSTNTASTGEVYMDGWEIVVDPDPLEWGAQGLEVLMFEGMAWHGMHPLDAFFNAKHTYAGRSCAGYIDDECIPADPNSLLGGLKAIHSYVYYGLPPKP